VHLIPVWSEMEAVFADRTDCLWHFSCLGESVISIQTIKHFFLRLVILILQVAVINFAIIG